MAPSVLTDVFCRGKMEGAAKILRPDGPAHDENREEYAQYDSEGFYYYRRTRLRAFLLMVKGLPDELFTLLTHLNFDKWKAQFPKLYRHNRQAVDAMVPAKLAAIHNFYTARTERLRGISYPIGALKAAVAEMKNRGLPPI